MYLQWWRRDILIVLEGEGIGTKQPKIAQNVPVYPIVGRKDKKISMMIFGWEQQKNQKKIALKLEQTSNVFEWKTPTKVNKPLKNMITKN